MSNNYATNQRNVIDEAMVCDESFTSNSTESMGDLLAAADSSSLGLKFYNLQIKIDIN